MSVKPLSPIRQKTELPTNLDGVRRLLLAAAPRLEPRQPGITAQFQYMDLTNPVQMVLPKGERVTVRFEPNGDTTGVKVEIAPPFQPLGPWKARWWSWWNRYKLRWMLKMARQAAFRQQVRDLAPPPGSPDGEAVQSEVLPPEGR